MGIEKGSLSGSSRETAQQLGIIKLETYGQMKQSLAC